MLTAIKKGCLTAIAFSTCALFSSTLQAAGQYGFACNADAPLVIALNASDIISNYDGIGYNLIYIPQKMSGSGNYDSLYTNSDGENYLGVTPPVHYSLVLSGAPPMGDAGKTGSYLGQPICLSNKSCAPNPGDFVAEVNTGLSKYPTIKNSMYPDDFIIVNSGLIPSYTDSDPGSYHIKTVLFTTTRHIKFLRLELFGITNPRVNPDVTASWMKQTGAEPLYFEYVNDSGGSIMTLSEGTITRPHPNSALKAFPQTIDLNELQAIDIDMSFGKGGPIGELYSGLTFYYFNAAQKNILNNCGH